MGRKRKVTYDQAVDPGKTRFELRFDTDVYEGIKRLADESAISVNQLMHGIARWAIRYGHPGEEASNDSDDWPAIHVKPQPGCIWFGHHSEDHGLDDQGYPAWSEPEIYFHLDYTERHVIRDDTHERPRRAKP